MRNDMFIDGKSVQEYGAVVLGSPQVSPAPVSHETFMGRNRTNFNVLSHDVGMKLLEVNLAFFGNDANEIQRNRSVFRSALVGKLNLAFDFDDFEYFAVYQADSELESEHKQLEISKFTFAAIQHKRLEVISGDTVYCESAIPKTDCRLIATISTSAASYTLGNAVFSNVVAGDIIVFDGIDGKVTKNGVDTAATWTKFNQLSRGLNTIAGATQIEYYPTYM